MNIFEAMGIYDLIMRYRSGPDLRVVAGLPAGITLDMAQKAHEVVLERWVEEKADPNNFTWVWIPTPEQLETILVKQKDGTKVQRPYAQLVAKRAIAWCQASKSVVVPDREYNHLLERAIVDYSNMQRAEHRLQDALFGISGKFRTFASLAADAGYCTEEEVAACHAVVQSNPGNFTRAFAMAIEVIVREAEKIAHLELVEISVLTAR